MEKNKINIKTIYSYQETFPETFVRESPRFLKEPSELWGFIPCLWTRRKGRRKGTLTCERLCFHWNDKSPNRFCFFSSQEGSFSLLQSMGNKSPYPFLIYSLDKPGFQISEKREGRAVSSRGLGKPEPCLAPQRREAPASPAHWPPTVDSSPAGPPLPEAPSSLREKSVSVNKPTCPRAKFGQLDDGWRALFSIRISQSFQTVSWLKKIEQNSFLHISNS